MNKWWQGIGAMDGYACIESMKVSRVPRVTRAEEPTIARMTSNLPRSSSPLAAQRKTTINEIADGVG